MRQWRQWKNHGVMEESWVNGAYGGNGGVIGERRNHRIMEES
jgi:hypothetical protein